LPRSKKKIYNKTKSDWKFLSGKALDNAKTPRKRHSFSEPEQAGLEVLYAGSGGPRTDGGVEKVAKEKQEIFYTLFSFIFD
jgi:hypothetical protein